MLKEEINLQYQKQILATTDKDEIKRLKQELKIKLLEAAQEERAAKIAAKKAADEAKAVAEKATPHEHATKLYELWEKLPIPCVWQIKDGVQTAYGLTNRDISNEVIYLRDKTNKMSFENHLIGTKYQDISIYELFKRMYSDWCLKNGTDYDVDWLSKLFDWWRINPDYEIESETEISSITSNTDLFTYFYFDAHKYVDDCTTDNYDTYQKFYLDNMNFPDVFCAYAWSIFEEQHMGRQALVWMSDGNEGKTIFINQLVSRLKYAAVGISDADLNDPHASDSTYNRRLIYNTDCKNRKFIQTEMFHKITGGDSVKVNPKFKTPFNAVYHARALIGTNDPPIVDSTKRNELSRIILIKTIRKPCFIPNLKQLLDDEFRAFLKHCRDKYRELCKDHFEITCPSEMFESIDEECTSNRTMLIREFVDENIVESPTHYLQRQDINKAAKASGIFNENDDTTSLIKYVRSKFNITSDTFRDDTGKKIRGLQGITFVKHQYKDFNRSTVSTEATAEPKQQSDAELLKQLDEIEEGTTHV